ncbi:hypothetical protein [Kitasatospora sp. NPDC085879]|uniref:hypothetical protein n=1 Tax=Kitasatospora sp. NPDC085879 TaxID=3154769 RepID=UPI0034189FCF
MREDEVPTEGETQAERVDALTEQLKERIYATITMVAVVVGLSVVEDLTTWKAALAVCATAVGLWLASLVADEQAYRIVHRRMASGRALRRMLFVSSPLLLSAVGPLLLIGAAAVGLMALHTALLASVVVSVVALFVWGCVSGLRMGSGPFAAIVAGIVDAVIGLAVVLVKLAGH